MLESVKKEDVRGFKVIKSLSRIYLEKDGYPVEEMDEEWVVRILEYACVKDLDKDIKKVIERFRRVIIKGSIIESMKVYREKMIKEMGLDEEEWGLN